MPVGFVCGSGVCLPGGLELDSMMVDLETMILSLAVGVDCWSLLLLFWLVLFLPRPIQDSILFRVASTSALLVFVLSSGFVALGDLR